MKYEIKHKHILQIFQVPRSQWPVDAKVNGFGEIDVMLQKYQKPEEADPMTKVQNELDETKIILHNTIEAVLNRWAGSLALKLLKSLQTNATKTLENALDFLRFLTKGTVENCRFDQRLLDWTNPCKSCLP